MSRVTRNDQRDAWMATVFRSRAEHSHLRSNCPTPERIWDAVRLQGSVEERLELIDHVSECPTCAEAWSLAAELDSEHVETARNASANTAPRSSFSSFIFPPIAFPFWRMLRLPTSWPALSVFYGRRALVMGAVPVLFLVAIFVVWRQTARPTEDVSATLQSRDQQGAVLSQSDFRLRWTPGPAGSRYDVTVMTPSMDVVAEIQNLEVTEYRVPHERLAGVAAGSELLWRVAARTPEGSMISSALFSVRLQQDILPGSAPESDEAAIRNLIATYERLLETRELARLRAIAPGLTTAQLDRAQRTIRLSDDVQEVAIHVESLQIEGRRATARIAQQDTAMFRGRPYVYDPLPIQVCRFEKTAAGTWVFVELPCRTDR